MAYFFECFLVKNRFALMSVRWTILYYCHFLDTGKIT
jgi:hypothetical protein